MNNPLIHSDPQSLAIQQMQKVRLRWESIVGIGAAIAAAVVMVVGDDPLYSLFLDGSCEGSIDFK